MYFLEIARCTKSLQSCSPANGNSFSAEKAFKDHGCGPRVCGDRPDSVFAVKSGQTDKFGALTKMICRRDYSV